MKQLHNWHQTKVGLLTFLVIEVALIYIFGSLSISRGNLWYYLLTLLFVVGAIQNLVKFIMKVVKIYA
jgi:hypothetical protein